MNTHELAWAAGLIDGEGYVGARRVDGIWRLRVDITQVDRYVLDRFARAVGVGSVYGPYACKTQPRHQYVVTGAEAQAAIAMIWRWLSPVKRAQAVDGGLKVKRTATRNRNGFQPACRRGHPFDAKNTWIYFQTAKGYRSRRCLKCARASQRLYRQRRLAHALLVAV